VKKAPRETDI